eukprot:TRINITY_DN21431_c0_g1_i1.p2 TRINITY_DN21431_c0_g1~~TRINITY_DN21431_c0_g1_i1.p2  ORF type:complete len:102 (-),score=16.40 TRINITY_DN21431_c0_g1_i1:236-541(-)
MYALYSGETKEERARTEEAEEAISQAVAHANLLAKEKWPAPGIHGSAAREQAIWLLWNEVVRPVALQYADRGATDTASRDTILSHVTLPPCDCCECDRETK